ncbi:MAG: cyclic nucleotide-binding domain-containing protein [Treponema sp.]|nr:cyclic nucleotide-binding domain-containing protein [Treponema sp.]
MEFSTDIIEKLSKLEIFSDFKERTDDSERILKKICASLEVRDFSKGDVIINEGDLGYTLYILYKGSVQVKRNTPGNEQFAVVNLSAEQNVFFGEVALVDSDRRSASVIALENCKTLCLDGDAFKALCDEEPLLGYRATYQIARRLASLLRRTNKDLLTLYEALLDEVDGE